MNKRIKAKWLKALRSGKYKQGTGILRRVDLETAQYKYCCLGVLADCSGVRWRQFYTDPNTGKRAPLKELDLLPRVVAARLGINDPPDDIETQLRLAKMNDEFGWDFGAIANWIEKIL